MNPTEYVQKNLASLGIEAKINDDHFVNNQVKTLPIDIHGKTGVPSRNLSWKRHQTFN